MMSNLEKKMLRALKAILSPKSRCSMEPRCWDLLKAAIAAAEKKK